MRTPASRVPKEGCGRLLCEVAGAGEFPNEGETDVTDSPAMPPADVERDLLDGIRAGDEQAAAAFDRRFRGRLLRAAQRRGIDAANAEDIVQETLLAAVLQISEHKFEGRVPVGAWVWGIFEKRLADRTRRDLRRQATFVPMGISELATGMTHGAAPDRGLHIADLRRRVRQVFSGLTPRQQMVLLMSVQGGLPTREIARILKLGQKTTEAALTAARKQFARLLGGGDEEKK